MNWRHSIPAILAAWAHSQPEKRCFTFLHQPGNATYSYTYLETYRIVRHLAREIDPYINAGDRVLLMHPSSPEFVFGFLASLYLGALPAPAFPPCNARHLRRLSSILRDCNPKVCLVAQDDHQKTTDWMASACLGGNMTCLITRRPSPSILSDATPTMHTPQENDLAFLQYTSGSTASPKGVMVTYSNLNHNARFIQRRWGLHPNHTVITWLPLFHDMGLITTVIVPLFVGCHGVIMPPSEFLKKPERWLLGISDYKAHASAAPPFAYDLCVQRSSQESFKMLNLTSWKVAIIGAEPVFLDTLERFQQAFAPCGFGDTSLKPAYGLAEATLGVSITDFHSKFSQIHVHSATLGHKVRKASPSTERGHSSKAYVSCGRPAEDQQTLVVDPSTATLCPDQVVGEIWLCGKSIARGYWESDVETRKMFRASLAGDETGHHLRTGDLGFLHNGELFITGRLKDLIIIRGENYYPQDIEQAAEQASPFVRRGGVAAFVSAEQRDCISVVAEVNDNATGLEQITQSISRCISEQHGLAVHTIVLIEARTIPKTTSGKIQRRNCALALTEGTLKSLYQTVPVPPEPPVVSSAPTGPIRDAAALTTWLVDYVSAHLHVKGSAIDLDDPLTTYGLDSVAAVQLATDLEQYLCKSVPATLAFDQPTIRQMATFLAAAGTSPSDRILQSTGSDEPIAVIGMACRFPGADDPTSFWDMLSTGLDAIAETPSSRWASDRYYDEDSSAAGKMSTRWGGFLNQIDHFDAACFGISPREAISMDPQQRILLEVTWTALEQAGILLNDIRGSSTGVFIGISSFDFMWPAFKTTKTIDAYHATGNSHSIAANRISYFFDLQGPSLAIDTACSSSLVALHTACQSIRAGESTIALAGGVNLLLQPETSVALSHANMMASDGRCKTFDDRADGYVRSEGCGMVVLKRLCDAKRDGNDVHAIIRGSSVNQDGRSQGLTAPNGPAQEAVVSMALQHANVQGKDIRYVECHGTGTPLGDPQEVLALQHVLGTDRDQNDICLLGSVKTNIGHLEAAAGIASFIKVVLSLKHRTVPGNLHFQRTNPRLNVENTCFVIPTESTPFADAKTDVFAGVSSFGFGGTNAHMIIRSAQPQPPVSSSLPEKPLLLPLSAKSEISLGQLLLSYEDYLAQPIHSIRDVCYTASVHRNHFAYRVAILSSSPDDLHARLREARNRLPSAKTGDGDPSIVFLFTGQGSQYVNMARELAAIEPHVRDRFAQGFDFLHNRLEEPLEEVVLSEGAHTDLIHQTMYAQPILYILQVALAELWITWGIRPSAMVGHSIGEYAAACIGGVFSFEQGLELISNRASLMQSLPSDGGMLAIFDDQNVVSSILQPGANDASIAAYNGPKATVVGGTTTALEEIETELKRRKIARRRLATSHAFHTRFMDPILEEFQAASGHVVLPSCSTIPWISTVTGSWMSPDEPMGSHYWREHMRLPVKFMQAMDALDLHQIDGFLEIGPQPTLLGLAQRCFKNKDPSSFLWLPSLKPDTGDLESMKGSLGQLYESGCKVRWKQVYQHRPGTMTSIPTYAFDRSRYWPEPVKEDTEDVEQESTSSDLSVHLLAEGRQRIKSGVPRFRLRNYPAFFDLLNRVSHRYKLETLLELGFFQTTDDVHTLDDILTTAGVQPNYRTVVHRWLQELADYGTLTSVHGAFQRTPKSEQDEPQFHHLRRFLRGAPPLPLLNYVEACGDNLSGLLKGTISPLEMLFPSGHMDRAEYLYQDFPVAQYYNSLIQGLIKTTAKYMETGKTLRVLEIGAGTGSTTAAVLFALRADQSAYTFTDLSDAFLQQAKTKFTSYPFVSYSILNIEEPPEEQGYERNSYDVIIAANVLHATKNLPQTLDHVHRLLTPEGRIFLWEATHHPPWFDMTFALIDGWQRHDDSLRHEVPTLTATEWKGAFKQHGFDEVLLFPESSQTQVCFGQHVIAARRAAPVTLPMSSPATTDDTTAEPLLSATDARLLYHTAWLPMQRDIQDTSETKRSFQLISTPSCPHTETLHDELKRRGFSDTCVEYLSSGLAQSVDPIQQEPGGKRFTDVVWIFGPQSQANSKPDVDDYAYHLAQWVKQQATDLLSRETRLWIVTVGAHALPDSPGPPRPELGMLWGLGRVIAVEVPKLWGGLIDLCVTATPVQVATRLCDEILGPQSDDHIALQDHERWVMRLHQTKPLQQFSSRWECRRNGSYLITGGLGGMGTLTAHWLTERGARHLVMVNRTALPARSEWCNAHPSTHEGQRIQTILELEAKDVQVHLLTADVGNFSSLQVALGRTGTKAWPPICGVIHAAGTLEDELLASCSRKNWEKVTHPKVNGARNLHLLTQEVNLDLFVMYSSAAALITAPGGASYAAANVYMDTLAHTRRQQGLHGLSINWGPIAGVGLAGQSDRTARLASRGIHALSPTSALAALEFLLLSNNVQASLIDVDWQTLLATYSTDSRPCLLQAMDNHSSQTTPTASTVRTDNASLSNTQRPFTGDHATFLRDYLGTLIMLDPALIDPTIPLSELGFDSIMAVQLKSEIDARYALDLAVTDLVQSSLDDLTNTVQEFLDAQA